MKHRINFLIVLFVGFSFGMINSASAQQSTDLGEIHGKVTEILDVSGYTYVEVDTDAGKVWGAGPITAMKIGDMIGFSKQMPMRNFHSKSLGRDFPIVYFIDQFITGKEAATSEAAVIASPHGQIAQAQTSKTVEGIKKIEGGNSITEIYTQKQDLAGKTVRVRGQVTKFTPGIMGKNWLHILDSSGPEDLTVTTAVENTVAIDDVVVIEGKLELDKDFGYGYVYAVILQDASIMKE